MSGSTYFAKLIWVAALVGLVGATGCTALEAPALEARGPQAHAPWPTDSHKEASGPATPTPAEIQSARKAFARIGVIGASQTAGFGAGVSLGKCIQAGLQCETIIIERASAMFFMRPLHVGKEQADFVATRDVTVLFALDYLFWFVYGSKASDRRLEDLQVAFDHLERFDCPIFVGDIPDMRGAAPNMLPPRAVPSPEEIKSINEQIHKWVNSRDRVTLLPLSKFAARVKAGEPFELGGVERHYKQSDVLIWDKLHANKKGQRLITQMCLFAVRDKFPALTADLIVEDEALTEAIRLRQLGMPGAKPKPKPTSQPK